MGGDQSGQCGSLGVDTSIQAQKLIPVATREENKHIVDHVPFRLSEHCIPQGMRSKVGKLVHCTKCWDHHCQESLY